MLTFDTETCGLFGMPVLIQYEVDDGPIKLYDFWREPIRKTLKLIEWICGQDVCGFNLAFDWFHLCKIYTTLYKFGHLNELPEDYINEIAMVEKDAWDGPCLKPRSACDLFLHARKGPYQSLMARKDIKINRVPTQIAFQLVNELKNRIKLDDIYFSRRPHADQWMICDSDSPDFKNVILKFAASSALKVLAHHVLKVEKDNILKFADIELDKKHRPKENGWAPYALALSTPEKRWCVYKQNKFAGYAWPGVIRRHIEHWAFNERARKYAGDDVKYTRQLWEHDVFGKPEPGDDDSELACMVAAVRWHGMQVDIPAIKEQRDIAFQKIAKAPINASAAKRYIGGVMSETMKAQFTSTKKQILEKMDRDLKCDCQLQESLGEFGDYEMEEEVDSGIICEKCKGSGRHPAADRCKEVIVARSAKKQIEVYDKIIQAGRFYPSFVIIGTLSSRMAGTDGLNAQGIGSQEQIRKCFKFADPCFSLSGGDFDAFEVVLAITAYKDAALQAAVTTIVPCALCNETGFILKKGKQCKCDICEGHGHTSQKIHALFAMELFPGTTYDDIIRSKNTDHDMYKIGKAGIFAMIYGGDWKTLVKKQSIPEHIAQAAEKRFISRFPGVQAARKRINDDFCSMQQVGDIGSKIIWNDPAEFVESFFGFRRYFTIENQIVKELFTLANALPKDWADSKIKVERQKGRVQTASGATCTALYGAAFGIQGCNMRAAANHVIQSSGATITKRVQRKVWDRQPFGVNPWVSYGINIHDEIMLCIKPEYTDEIGDIVDSTVESFRPMVPLIKFEFKKHMSSWAAK